VSSHNHISPPLLLHRHPSTPPPFNNNDTISPQASGDRLPSGEALAAELATDDAVAAAVARYRARLFPRLDPKRGGGGRSGGGGRGGDSVLPDLRDVQRLIAARKDSEARLFGGEGAASEAGGASAAGGEGGAGGAPYARALGIEAVRALEAKADDAMRGAELFAASLDAATGAAASDAAGSGDDGADGASSSSFDKANFGSAEEQAAFETKLAAYEDSQRAVVAEAWRDDKWAKREFALEAVVAAKLAEHTQAMRKTALLAFALPDGSADGNADGKHAETGKDGQRKGSKGSKGSKK